MTEAITTQCVLFPSIFKKPVFATFDQTNGSSDGGAVLLKAADDRLDLIRRLASSVIDPRQAGKVAHTFRELLAQRIFAIAMGYPDGNDAARLAADPIHKLIVERDPIHGDDLASQPTLSRFENSLTPRDLYRLGRTMADTVIEHHRARLRGRVHRVTIDLDPTDDPTHGAQQLSFFNGHYDSWCYLPVVGFLTFNDEPDQHLFTAVLRPGNATAKKGAISLLRQVLKRLRVAFPRALFRIRLDGGFAAAEVFDFLDDQLDVDYVVAMAKNSVLKRRAHRLMGRVRKRSRRSRRTEHDYSECLYAAKRWPVKRRVIIKAEVVQHPGRSMKDNPRFVVTNMSGTPQWIYEEVYCARGDIENRIKELQNGMDFGRTSCSRFFANQFRVLLTAAAYVLMQVVRSAAAKTSLARAQVSTLRERLLKLGVRVVESVRRIVLHLPRAFPDQKAWLHIAGRLGAEAG
jgi:Transposase DDE domain group 1